MTRKRFCKLFRALIAAEMAPQNRAILYKELIYNPNKPPFKAIVQDKIATYKEIWDLYFELFGGDEYQIGVKKK